MPTNTDLVTDLPADFEVFGQAVDTSMADLLGGTTGQILAKNSATNMDFVWIANDQGDITGVTAGTGITVTSPTGPVPTVSIDTATTVDKTTAQTLTNKTLTSPVLTTPSISNINAKGDILVGTADNTLGIITAGSNGETLVADSAATTGLRYSATPSASNPVLNSAFQVWQRGTTGTTTSGITYPSADRWNAWTFSAGGSVTLSRQATGDTTNLPFVQYCGRFQRVAGNTNTGLLMLGQAFETVNSIPFAGKTVTYSFYARKGANYSEASSQLNAQLYSNTTTDVSLNTLQATATTVASSAVTLTTTWQRFTITGTVGATATQLATVFFYAPVGTAGANDYFEVTGVQLDIGSVALPFRTYAATIQGETSACQRYYWRGTSTNAYGTVAVPVIGASSTTAYGMYRAPVTMRTTPSAIEYANLALNDTGGATALTAVAINRGNPDFLELTLTAASGLTQYRTYFLCGNNNTAAYLGISAEL